MVKRILDLLQGLVSKNFSKCSRCSKWHEPDFDYSDPQDDISAKNFPRTLKLGCIFPSQISPRLKWHIRNYYQTIQERIITPTLTQAMSVRTLRPSQRKDVMSEVSEQMWLCTMRVREHLHDERERESERIKTTSTLPTGKLISYICSIASGAQLGYAAHNQISNMYFVMWSFIRFQKIEIHLKKLLNLSQQLVIGCMFVFLCCRPSN